MIALYQEDVIYSWSLHPTYMFTGIVPNSIWFMYL